MKKELGVQKATIATGSEQPLELVERELVEEAYANLEIFQQGCKDYHDRAKENRKIILMDDPRQDAQRNPKQDKKTIQLQTLKSTFNCIVADQMDNMPEAQLSPERADLIPVVDDMNDAVRYVFAHNKYEELHRVRVEDFVGVGTAITQVCWDQTMDGGKGNIALIRWPVEAFLWDPMYENIQDARACIKVSWHPLSWYAAHYPDKAEYIQNENGSHESVGMTDAQAAKYGQDEELAMLMEYWYRRFDAKTNRYTINVAYFAGGALLEHAEDVFDHGMYPFVLDVFSRCEGMPVGPGQVDEMAPTMRYINRYMSYIDMNLRMSSKGRLLLRRGSNIDKEALADWSRDVIEGDRVAPEDVHWLQNQPFTGMVVQQLLQLQSDIKQDSGQNQMTRGETAGGVTAASAISALQEAGGKITRLRTAVLNHGFARIVEQVMWLMHQFYDDNRRLMISGRTSEIDASPKHLFGEKDSAYPAPPYSVQVQVSRRNPLRVQAQNDLFLQAYSMSAQAGTNFPLTTLFQLLNVDGKDKILPVLEQNDKTTQLIQSLQQQIEQLTVAGQEQQKVMASLQQTIAKQNQALARGQAVQYDPTGLNAETNTK